jgi:hypothetical protein
VASQPICWGATGMAAKDATCARLNIKDVVAAIHMTGAALGKVCWQPG